MTDGAYLGLGFSGTLNLLRAVLIVLSALVLWRFRLLPTSRQQVRILAIGWIGLITFEYWAFGSMSFIMIGNELEWSIPFYQYMNDWHDGGSFTHAFAGGNDVWAMVGSGGQYLSLERFLMKVLPLGPAIGVLKILAATAGFIGTYLVARRFCDGDRMVPFALAALFPLNTHLYLLLTASTGISFSAIPLIVYMVVFRAGGRYYYLGVLSVAALTALSSMVPNSVVAVLFAIPVAALFVNTRKYRQIAAGFGLMAAALLLNWHETLYGMSQLASLTQRFADGPRVGNDLLDLLIESKTIINLFTISSFMAVASLAILALKREVFFFRAAGGLLIAVGAAPLLALFPWEIIGLKMLEGIGYHYTRYAFPLIAMITFAQATVSVAPAQTRLPRGNFFFGRRALSVFVLAAAVGQMGWYKAYNGSIWLSDGGLSLLSKAGERLDMSWVPDEPVRVISVPYRLPKNFAAALGLHSFDGGVHLFPLSLNIFWKGIVNPKKGPHDPPYDPLPYAATGISANLMDLKCCRRYRISEYLDFDLLRVANVGFILSVLPLEGGGLTQVAGPLSDADVPPRRNQPLWDRISGH